MLLMAKIRIYDLGHELNVPPKDLVTMCETLGLPNKTPSSSIEDTTARALREMILRKNAPPAPPEEKPAPAPAPTPTKFQDFRSNVGRGAAGANPARANVHRSGMGSSPAAPAAPRAASSSEDVSSDKLQDFRETRDVGGIVQNPARSGPGARSDAPRPGTNPGFNNAPRPGGPTSGPSNSAAPNTGAPGATPGAPGTPGAAPGAPVTPGSRPGPANAGFGGNRPAFNANKRMGNFRGSRSDRRALNNGRGERRPRYDERELNDEVDVSGQPTEGSTIEIPENITVTDLAARMGRTPSELIKKLFSMNIMRAANQPLPTEVASQIARSYGYSIEVATSRLERQQEEETASDSEAMVSVPPVVTIMGHVDHGKTSLLDIIRSANVQAGEAGGITQRIGAYEVDHNGETIVFLDTPGHEAFTRMRARGAHVTDIAVLVVAADDGVMPQTREAIDHARAAKVPIIVAMNKMDRAEADPNRVNGELAEVGLIPEDYGGDTVVIPVSAKTGQGVQELLDMILLVAELQELKANPTGPAEGTIIEANQDANRGAVATVLTTRGTLSVGDNIVVGEVFGRVRAMFDYKGEAIQKAGPKKPVSILGLGAAPAASDHLRVLPGAREAREAAQDFAAESKDALQVQQQVSLKDLFSKMQKGAAKDLNLIVKADGQGSVEAMCQSLQKLEHPEVKVRILSRGVGNVSENDVNLAEASQAIIVAFAVGTESAAFSLADRDNVEIRSYTVIYDAIDDVKAAMAGMLSPIYEERLAGTAEVRATFSSAKAGTIAGCYVLDGKIIHNSVLRVFRAGNRIYEGKLDSLKHVKANVREMSAGQECGIACSNFNDFQEGDILQSIIMDRIQRAIDDTPGKEPARVPAPELSASRR
jgi:translation initiation factor IF-2